MLSRNNWNDTVYYHSFLSIGNERSFHCYCSELNCALNNKNIGLYCRALIQKDTAYFEIVKM